MSGPLSEQQLDEISGRAAAAAPGPWETDTYPGPGGGIGVANESDLWIVPVQDLDPADAEFIAHARMDVPALLAEVDARAKRIAELEAERDALAQWQERVTEEVEEFEDAAQDDPRTPQVARTMIRLLRMAMAGEGR